MSNLQVNAINGVDVQNIAKQTARAWVNFNGTGVVAIRKAYNVASVTDNGVGVYAVNFSTPLPDGDYAVLATTGPAAGASPNPAVFGTSNLTVDVPPTTTSVTVATSTSPTTMADYARVSVAIFD